MRWDLFCRVIDNHGDVGVCWRLACDLAARGHAVRLWLDDPRALAWMAPSGAPGVEVQRWTERDDWPEPGDVVVEAFGCELPDAVVARMAAQPRPPAWINLEYLSAEDYVERSHRLPSPRYAGPGVGLTKHFFYPGFTPATGGLIREPGLTEARAAFDGAAWLARLGLAPREGERVVSLFCYPNPAVPALLAELARKPHLLLVTPGLASDEVARALGRSVRPGEVTPLGCSRVAWLPALPQTEFDRLLWSCDLNFVRGEDSLVRALWACRPFVWHIYPQDDAAHRPKLEAFLDRLLEGADRATCQSVRRAFLAWNGFAEGFTLAATEEPGWRAAVARWRDALLAQDDLATQLLRFVARTG